MITNYAVAKWLVLAIQDYVASMNPITCLLKITTQTNYQSSNYCNNRYW